MSSDFGICNSNNPEQLEEAFGKLGLFVNRPEPCIICTACQYALHTSAEAVSRHLWSVHETPPAARKGLNRVVKSLRFPNPSTLLVRHDGSTLHPHLSIAERFKVPLFELMKVWAAASQQCPVSQLYSSVKLLHVSSPSIPSSPSAICLFPRTFSYSIPPVELPAVPTSYLNGTSRASERHNLDLYPSSSPSSVSLHPCPAQYPLY